MTKKSQNKLKKLKMLHRLGDRQDSKTKIKEQEQLILMGILFTPTNSHKVNLVTTVLMIEVKLNQVLE